MDSNVITLCPTIKRFERFDQVYIDNSSANEKEHPHKAFFSESVTLWFAFTKTHIFKDMRHHALLKPGFSKAALQ